MKNGKKGKEEWKEGRKGGRERRREGGMKGGRKDETFSKYMADGKTFITVHQKNLMQNMDLSCDAEQNKSKRKGRSTWWAIMLQV